MINIAWFESALLVLMVYMRSAETASCPQSLSTMACVPSCPKSKEEWDRRAEMKKCSLVSQQCGQLDESVYHCVINTFANQTLEVCAPKVLIIGHSCVEYNVRGATIQGSQYVKCAESCPLSYTSTDVYKYQDCFKIAGRKTWTETNNEGIDSNFNIVSNPVTRAWQIVALLSIAININVILFTVIPRWIARRRTRKYKRNEDVNTPFLAISERTKDTPLLVSSKRTKGIYVAAIDIGDIFLTMAISLPSSPEDVKMLGSSEKMFFFFNHRSNDKFFGKEAVDEYLKDTNNNRKHQDNRLFKLNEKNLAPEHYKEALSCIVDRAKIKLFDNMDNVKPSDFHYVFVVPNYWNEDELNKLNENLLENETLREYKFCVIRRKVTLSSFIHEVKARVVCLNFDVDNLVLRFETGSTTYAILHVGSSHYDLMFVKAEKDQNELTWNVQDSPDETTKEWESHNLPMDRVLNFFAQIYGEDTIEEWKKKKEFISFTLRFEELLENVDERMSGKCHLELSKELMKGLKKKAKGDPKGYIDQKINGKPGIKRFENNWTFEIESNWLKPFFNGIEQVISDMLQDKKDYFQKDKVNCVVMTGAYSERKIIWDIAEKVWFKNQKVTIVVPENAYVFAMGGAYYGQNKKWTDAKIQKKYEEGNIEKKED